METIFISTENSKTNELHRFKLDLTDKLNLKNPNKNMANLSIYCTWKNIKSECKNNEFKISAPTWNDTFDLPDGSYTISDIQDYFEFIIKKHETLWNFKRDEIIGNINLTNNNSSSYKYKSNLVGSTDADRVNRKKENVEKAVPLKYLSNFWRSLEMPLISCKDKISLK